MRVGEAASTRRDKKTVAEEERRIEGEGGRERENGRKGGRERKRRRWRRRTLRHEGSRYSSVTLVLRYFATVAGGHRRQTAAYPRF